MGNEDLQSIMSTFGLSIFDVIVCGGKLEMSTLLESSFERSVKLKVVFVCLCGGMHDYLPALFCLYIR